MSFPFGRTRNTSFCHEFLNINFRDKFSGFPVSWKAKLWLPQTKVPGKQIRYYFRLHSNLCSRFSSPKHSTRFKMSTLGGTHHWPIITWTFRTFDDNLNKSILFSYSRWHPSLQKFSTFSEDAQSSRQTTKKQPNIFICVSSVLELGWETKDVSGLRCGQRTIKTS